jgi:hypothetical protein
LWRNELNLQVQRVIGLGRRRSYDDEGFVVCSLLLPPSATFVHNDIFRFGNLNLGRRGILTWDVGRVRGNLLKCRWKK